MQDLEVLRVDGSQTPTPMTVLSAAENESFRTAFTSTEHTSSGARASSDTACDIRNRPPDRDSFYGWPQASSACSAALRDVPFPSPVRATSAGIDIHVARGDRSN